MRDDHKVLASVKGFYVQVKQEHIVNFFDDLFQYRFKDKNLLLEALRHRSASTSLARSYERLEFLGDRVLGVCISDLLLKEYPTKPEGFLSSSLAKLVCTEALAEISKSWGVSPYIMCGASERGSGLRDNPSVLADVCEALLGAIYLDSDGLSCVYNVVETWWGDALRGIESQEVNPKTALQEWAMAHKFSLPSYRVVSRDGPDHAPFFVMAVCVNGKEAQGKGKNKQDASVTAARAWLKMFGE